MFDELCCSVHIYRRTLADTAQYARCMHTAQAAMFVHTYCGTVMSFCVFRFEKKTIVPKFEQRPIQVMERFLFEFRNNITISEPEFV